MLGILTAVHILIAIVLILLVLLQSSQGTDIAGAFGGMGSQAAFGPRGTVTFLSKATVVLAAVFMVTSVTLSVMGSRSASGGESVLSGEQAAAPSTSPAPRSYPAPTLPTTSVPEGAPAVQVGTDGLQGMKATVTVENPGKTPDANTPAASIQPGPATPAQTPAQPATPATTAPANKAPAPSGQ